MIHDRAKLLIDVLDLQPHPEGGFFSETYRSNDQMEYEIRDHGMKVTRNVCTSIYYLLTGDAFSAFHRINQDEMWHFYEGGTLLIHELEKDGQYKQTRVGSDIESGDVFQYVVRGGHYFAVELISKDSYGLAGCTVAPGFDFADFEMPGRNELTKKFPQHLDIISRLTRS